MIPRAKLTDWRVRIEELADAFEYVSAEDFRKVAAEIREAEIAAEEKG